MKISHKILKKVNKFFNYKEEVEPKIPESNYFETPRFSTDGASIVTLKAQSIQEFPTGEGDEDMRVETAKYMLAKDIAQNIAEERLGRFTTSHYPNSCGDMVREDVLVLKVVKTED